MEARGESNQGLSCILQIPGSVFSWGISLSYLWPMLSLVRLKAGPAFPFSCGILFGTETLTGKSWIRSQTRSGNGFTGDGAFGLNT